MTNPSPVAPFVVVPTPGQEALAVLLTRGVRDPMGRELLSGMTCGFTRESAVSLVVGGWGVAHCFDEAAAETWVKALRPHFGEDATMDQVLARLTGPFIELLKKERAAELAMLDAEARADAEKKATAEAAAAAQKLADDIAASEAAAYAKLQEQVKAQEEAARAAGVEPVSTTPTPIASTVSNASTDAEALKQPEPQPTPPAPPSAGKRGSKSPR